MNRDKHIDNPSVDTLTSVVEGLARRLVDVSKIGQDRRERSCILNSSQIIVEIAILSTPRTNHHRCIKCQHIIFLLSLSTWKLLP